MRAEWTVQWSAQSVREAALRQMAYHEGRVVFWKSHRDDAEEDLRTSGLELRSMPVTGGDRIDAVVDPLKARRLEECRQKVAGHEELCKQYRQWAEFLENSGAVFNLNFGDFEFFAMKAAGVS